MRMDKNGVRLDIFVFEDVSLQEWHGDPEFTIRVFDFMWCRV